METPSTVALFGGTGFVGQYLVDALVSNGYRVRLLDRSGRDERPDPAAECVRVRGEIDDADAVREVLKGADAFIYNIGILREFPERGITFRALQFEGARRVIDLAPGAGVRRVLLMSANGVRAGGTAYQRTKFEAERYLASTDLDWTVFRPSVIFGDPRGRMEFATQLLQEIVLSPLPAPMFYTGFLPHEAGSFQLSPVHVEDVAQAFVSALEDDSTIGRVLELGGPRPLSWRAIIQAIAAVAGRRKPMLPAPAAGVSAMASVLDRFEAFPITRDQIAMLMEGNTCAPEHLIDLGIQPRPFSVDHLGYLKPAASASRR